MKAAVTSSNLFILYLACTACADIYYVATDGNDRNNGTDLPWRTLNKAGIAAVAGDTVFIRAGTYRERLTPANSGTAGRPVTFSAFPGDSVVLDAQGLPGSGIVQISAVSHVTVSGLHAVNGGGAGFWIINASYVTLHGNHTYNTVSSGIIVSEFGVNTHVRIDSNEVELACNDGGQECVSIAKCDSFEITRNHIHHGGPGTNGGEGIDTKFGSSNGLVAHNYIHHLSRQGLYADAWSLPTSNITFHGNTVHDCGFGIGAASETGGTLSNVVFRDNLVYNCDGPGLYILMSAGPLDGVAFINNTVCNAGNGWGSGMWFNGAQATNVTVRNNLFHTVRNAPFQIDKAPAGMTADHNLAPRADGMTAGWFITGSALFADTAAGDFRLAAGSPGIDRGAPDSTALSDDCAGVRRVSDGDCDYNDLVDIGAYEFVTSCSAIRRADGGLHAVSASSAVEVRCDLKGRVVRSAPARPSGNAGVSSRKTGSTVIFIH